MNSILRYFAVNENGKRKLEENEKSSIPDIEEIHLNEKKFQVISASRRTDIPGCYLRSFMKSMSDGYIDVRNPRFHDQKYRISLKEKDVDCIAWWSKNYGPWIKEFERNPQFFTKYSAHYFNFTINSDSELEHLPVSLDKRLSQLEWLAQNFGSNAINYRFDPIVHWREITDPPDFIRDNLSDFEMICSRIGSFIKEISFSFCERYPQVVENMRLRDKVLITLSLEDQKLVLDDLIKIADQYGIRMKSCCNTALGVESSSCISKEKIESLLGKKLRSRRKDPGQRKTCNCVITRDVGDYNQLCRHGCLYCYANPKID